MTEEGENQKGEKERYFDFLTRERIFCSLLLFLNISFQKREKITVGKRI